MTSHLPVKLKHARTREFVETAVPMAPPWSSAASKSFDLQQQVATAAVSPRGVSDGRSRGRSLMGGATATDPSAAALPPISPPERSPPAPSFAVSSTALNAAALQTVHRHGRAGNEMGTSSPRVYNGQILWQRKGPAALDGLSSSDISYFGDRIGHGLNHTSRDRRKSGARTARAQTAASSVGAQLSTFSSDAYHVNATAAASELPLGGSFTARTERDITAPSSRAEAMATAARLRRGLESLGEISPDSTDDVARELALWDGAMNEVIRQVRLPTPPSPPATPPSPPVTPPSPPTTTITSSPATTPCLTHTSPHLTGGYPLLGARPTARGHPRTPCARLRSSPHATTGRHRGAYPAARDCPQGGGARGPFDASDVYPLAQCCD